MPACSCCRPVRQNAVGCTYHLSPRIGVVLKPSNLCKAFHQMQLEQPQRIPCLHDYLCLSLSLFFSSSKSSQVQAMLLELGIVNRSRLFFEDVQA